MTGQVTDLKNSYKLSFLGEITPTSKYSLYLKSTSPLFLPPLLSANLSLRGQTNNSFVSAALGF